jgi:hypothetical protein
MNEQMSSHSLFRSHALATHAQMSAALAELARARETSRPTRAWRALEAALLDHLRDEDELLLPDFSLAFPGEAARIRGAHERIRQLMAGANKSAQLDAQALDDLSRLARDCSDFEERMLYPWAEQRLRQSKKGEYLRRGRTHAGAGTAP